MVLLQSGETDRSSDLKMMSVLNLFVKGRKKGHNMTLLLHRIPLLCLYDMGTVFILFLNLRRDCVEASSDVV